MGGMFSRASSFNQPLNNAHYAAAFVRSRFAFDLTGLDLPEVRLQIRLPRPFSRD